MMVLTDFVPFVSLPAEAGNRIDAIASIRADGEAQGVVGY